MKTLKDFLFEQRSQNTTSLKENVVNEPMVLEAVECVNENFNESEDSQSHNRSLDPPAVLIMRRKSIRQFPNNQRVALYYVDKIDKYVTVPYTAMQWSSSGAMDTEQ